MTKYVAMVGNYILMTFYATMGRQMMLYFSKALRGDLDDLNSEVVAGKFGSMLTNPALMGGFMVTVILLCLGVCVMDLQKDVERITKIMTVCLLVLMAMLVTYSMVLPGGGPGLESYLKPDFGEMAEAGIDGAVFAVLGQSFFALSIGTGTLTTFGSYTGKERVLTGEAVGVTPLDILVAFMAGLIILPACFAYSTEFTAGLPLIFITLPNVLNHMTGGRIWGTLFFLSMSSTAFSAIIAAFRNIVSFAMDLTECTFKKAVLCNITAITILSVSCALDSGLWGSSAPLGEGSTVLGLEDLILSSNLLSIGSMLYLLPCTNRYGWGSKRFMAEANEGEGIHFPV